MGVSVGRPFAAARVFPAAEPAWVKLSLRLTRRFGLSARLFLLTIAFIGLAEVLIYVPAVATYRRDWLSDRIIAAQVATLVLDAAPDHRVSDALAQRLLAGVGARAIALREGEHRRVLAPANAADVVADTIDLRRTDWTDALVGAWRTLWSPAEAPIRVIGHGRDRNETVEILIEEAPLREALTAFSLRLLVVSLIVAAGAMSLVFLVLQRAVVRPMRRLARNIAAFAHDPENADRVIAPSGRFDAIGDAEAALAGMEIALSGELRHKRRLAGLGLSISKISHELRNLLTTAQLLGDRLEKVDDPVVRRVAPRLVATLDRANHFCEATLAYGRAAEQHPQRRMVALAPILAELPDLAGLAREGRPTVRVDAPLGLRIDADAEQLSRILANLVRNAVQALDGSAPPDEPPLVTIAAHREGSSGSGRVTITVTDNGPGLPERARAHLFAPFQGATRAGGTGLGLAIAAELTDLNGGRLTLDPSENGARFRLVIPDRLAASMQIA